MVGADGTRRAVSVDLDAHHTVAQLASTLGWRQLYHQGHLLEATTLFAQSGICTGDELHERPTSASDSGAADFPVMVRVLDGPSVGAAFTVDPGGSLHPDHRVGGDPASPVASLQLRSRPPRWVLSTGSVVDGGRAFQLGPEQVRIDRVPPIPPGTALTRFDNGGERGRITLDRPDIIIGRADDCDLILADDPAVSSYHARLFISEAGWTVSDLGSTNGVELEDGILQSSSRPLRAEEAFGIGRTALRLDLAHARSEPLRVVSGAAVGTVIPRPALSAPERIGRSFRLGNQFVAEPRPESSRGADLRPTGTGMLEFNRPGRSRRRLGQQTVEFPRPQQLTEPRRLSPIELGAPLVGAAALALILGQPRYLLFGLLGPLMMGARTLSAKREARRRSLELDTEHDAAMAEAHRQLAVALAIEEDHLNHQCPFLPDVLEVAEAPTDRLWERRFDDDDFLRLRVGTTALDSQTTIIGEPPAGAANRLSSAPATVDLKAVGVLGVVDPDIDRARRVAAALVCQVAALHSPLDTRLYLLTSPDTAGVWSWVQWLPHIRIDDEVGSLVTVGNGPETVEHRLAEIRSVVDQRTDQGQRERHRYRPAITVVLDGARTLRDEPALPSLLRDGPSVGVYFIAIDTSTSRLPDEARARVILSHGSSTVGEVQIDGDDHLSEVVIDLAPQPSRLEAFARRLAPITEIRGDDSQALPTQCRLIDLLGLDPATEAASALARWSDEVAPPITAAVVGVGLDGEFEVDLARQGPHALIAGTTGSGKSELLLTFLYGLVRANRPDRLGLVIIDYKGGADFVDLADLPHCRGLITQLDGGGAARVIDSLNAEMNRRQAAIRLLREQGTISDANIDTVWREAPQLATQEGLGRLVIVVDEFAQLKRFDPDFVHNLVSVTRIGRSIGVHLVLVTQRPAGQVSDEMRANTGLRMILRTEKGESREMLESDHADLVPRSAPGRGWVRIAEPAPRLVEFQTARVGGSRTDNPVDLAPPVAHAIGWATLGLALPASTPGSTSSNTRSDLSVLTRALVAAGEEAGIEPVPSPWLPELPPVLGMDLTRRPGAYPDLALGRTDLVDRQRQDPFTWSPLSSEALAVVGSSGSGRTTALRTLALSAAVHYPPERLNLHILDGATGLLGLGALPQTGSTIQLTQRNLVSRFVQRLNAEHRRRRSLMTARGAVSFADLAASRDNGTSDPLGTPPLAVILIDGWERLSISFEYDSSEMQTLRTLIQDGKATGIRVVATGDIAFGGDARLSPLFGVKLVLPLVTDDAYGKLGLRHSQVPTARRPGRGLILPGMVDVQVAVADPSRSDGSGQTAAAADLASQLEARHGNPTIDLTVRELPTVVSLADLPPAGSRRFALPIGLAGDDAAPFTINLRRIEPGLLVLGDAGRGITATLRLLGSQAQALGCRVVAVTGNREEWQATADAVLGFDDESPPSPDGDLDIPTWLRREPTIVVVDRGMRLGNQPIGRALIELMAAPQEHTAVVIAERPSQMGGVPTGPIAKLISARNALVLSPTHPGAALPVVRTLPATAVTDDVTGRAVLIVEGDPCDVVQLANIDA